MGTLLIVAIIVAIIAYTMGKGASKKSEQPRGIAFTTSYEDRDSDSWEGGMWEAVDPHKIAANLRLEYTDAKGQRTTRSVMVREFDNTLHGGTLMGICELRDAHRTFRFDRIRSCIDLGTGEVVNDVRAHLNKLYETTPERSTDLLVSDYLDALKVVYYVAKADGQYRKAEKEVITQYVKILVRDARITSEMIDAALQAVDIPTIHAFKLAVGRITRGGQIDPSLLNKCCKEIVATQGAVHSSEQDALDYIERKIAEQSVLMTSGNPKNGLPRRQAPHND